MVLQGHTGRIVRCTLPPGGLVLMLGERVGLLAQYIIKGGRRLTGTVEAHGAKNAVLPLLAATLLTKKSTLHNCPQLTDCTAACNILRYLGCQVAEDGNTIAVDPSALQACDIPDNLMREMRSSVLFLGAIIACCGKARISLPGGCELGPRPIDLHLKALEKLGVVITEDHGYLECTVPDTLRGADIILPFPSVGATENTLLAACTARGKTILHNAAREPEITDLVDFLNAAGARIAIVPNGSIHIDGVKQLGEVEHRVIPDRIVAATYLTCAAITGGSITLTRVVPEHMKAIFPLLEEMGADLEQKQDSISLKMPRRPGPVRLVSTMPYPGFPTDAQAPLMALSTVANGSSVYVERIFENRYKHAAELARMGAKIKVEGNVAVVEGVGKLHGAPVVCTDLRGGAALVVAALAAEDTSHVDEIFHVERGYQDFEQILCHLGADIRRKA